MISNLLFHFISHLSIPMDSHLILFCVLLLSSTSQSIYECDFDDGEKCLIGLPSASFVLLNESDIIDPPRQPPSDVSAIETSNDNGECSFPYPFGPLSMYFCVKTDVDLPSTCLMKDGNGSKLNCSEGEYGYQLFEDGDVGSRDYDLDFSKELEGGEHCFGIDYFLSNGDSEGEIRVIIEDPLNGINQTILRAFEQRESRWSRLASTFLLDRSTPKFYIEFVRGRRFPSDSVLPFYLAIDRIRLIDLPCGPTTTTTSTSTSSSTLITSPAGTTTTTTTPMMTMGGTTPFSSTSSTSETTSTSSSTPSSTTPSTSPSTSASSSNSPSTTSPGVTTTTTTTSAGQSPSISVRWNVLLALILFFIFSLQ